MVEARHTPGPWHVWQATEDRWEICEPDKPHRHSHFASIKVGNMWGDEGKANAHLIAAAPELLASLKDCISRLVAAFPDCEEYKPIQDARAAIAKAEGRS